MSWRMRIRNTRSPWAWGWAHALCLALAPTHPNPPFPWTPDSTHGRTSCFFCWQKQLESPSWLHHHCYRLHLTSALLPPWAKKLSLLGDQRVPWVQDSSALFVDIKAHISNKPYLCQWGFNFHWCCNRRKRSGEQRLAQQIFCVDHLDRNWEVVSLGLPTGNVGKKGNKEQVLVSPHAHALPRGTTFQARICNRPVPRHPMDTSTVNRGVLKKQSLSFSWPMGKNLPCWMSNNLKLFIYSPFCASSTLL